MRAAERLDALAAALAYPEDGREERLERCAQLVAESGPPEAREAFARHAEACRGESVGDLQEDYTRTFDLDPSCSLEIGWHLFGENYGRGEFLVEMRRALRELGLEERGELPDHLVHVLPVLGRLEPARAGGFATASLLPAIDKMLDAFGGKGGRWEDLVRTVRATVVDVAALASKEAARG